MALVKGGVTYTRPIPHEDGCTMTFKQLSWAQLRDARQAKAIRGYKEGRQEAEAMGPDMLRMLRESAEAQVKAAVKPDADKPAVKKDVTEEERAAAERTRLETVAAQYDPGDILHRTLVAWHGQGYDGEPINPNTIAELDEVTMRWAVAEVVAIHHPAKEAAPTSTSTSP